MSQNPTSVNTYTDISYGTDGLQKVDVIVPNTFDITSNVNPNPVKGVVVWTHGGGWEEGDKSTYTQITNPIALANYIVVSINYRLTTAAAPLYETPTGFFPNDLNDIKTVYKYLLIDGAGASAPDPTSQATWAKLRSYVLTYGVFFAGDSAGGHLTTLATFENALDNNGLFPVGMMNFVGPMNLVYDAVNNPYGTAAANLLNVYTQSNSSLLPTASPYYRLPTWELGIPNLQETSCKFYFWYNDNDTLVPPSSITPFVNNLTSYLPGKVTKYEVTVGARSAGSDGYPSIYAAGHNLGPDYNTGIASATIAVLDNLFPLTPPPPPPLTSFYLSGSDLGQFRSNDNYYIPITAHDPAPQLGPVAYNLVELLDGGSAICTSSTYGTNKLDLGTSTTGTTGITTTSFGSSVSSSTWLPSNLHLDPATGYIYGYLAPQTEYLKKYAVTVSATKSYTTSTASFTVINTFTLATLSQDPDVLTWVSSSTQSIIGGLISELSLIATHSEPQSPLEYSFVGTNTPYFGGFTITNHGNIVGQGITGTYTATVVAWNPYYPVELFDDGESYQTQDYEVYGGYANSFNGLAYTNTSTSFQLDGGHVDTFGAAIDGGTAKTATVYSYISADGGNARSTYGSTDFYLNGGNAQSTYEITIFSGGTSVTKYIQPLHDPDGGSADSVYTINDWPIDGGSVQTLFGTNDRALDGGVSTSIYNIYDLSGGYAATVYGQEDLNADCGHAQLIPVFDPSLAGPSYIYPFSTQTLTLNVTTPLVDVPYTGIYVRPFLNIKKREAYSKFINNSTIFPSNFMYRNDDPHFGMQKDLRMIIEFGIQSINLDDYATALWENFNRRRLTFGNVKVARGKDQLDNYLYDVVYIDIIDNIDGAKQVIYDQNNLYYPASIANMRTRLESIVLPNYTYISVDQYHLPKFMQTAQAGTYLPTNYIKVIPLCYTLPGKSSGIVDQIKLSGFDFKLYDFEIDRLIIQNSLDNATDKYLLFPRRDITSGLIQDNLIFGIDGVEIVDNNGNPITRT